MKTLIIEKPSLSPLPNRIGWAFFTAFFWIVWIYLWMPLITLLLWWFGFTIFDKYFLHYSLSELVELEQLIILYNIVIAVLAVSLLAWAGIEFLRFRHVHQRHQPMPVEIAELAEFAHIPTNKMAELSSTRRMIVHHDEHGKFLYAEI
jgi:biofilm PGA synthesis protein PgaD